MTMLPNISVDHKKHLQFLTKQSTEVLQDFCKLVFDYLENGPNLKIYNTAAQKLQVEPHIIKNSVEGLLNLLLESCKCKIQKDDFQLIVIRLGFTEEQELVLSQLYLMKQEKLTNALFNFGLNLYQYHDMEWRFEVQVASRSLLQQVIPMAILDFTLKNFSNSKKIEHVLLQTDPNNLLHLIQELEIAVREGHSRYIRNISRISD